MEYQVLIFMTEKSLSAVETVSENDCEIISIDGNETMEYQEEKDIRKFCDCIKEYYSIDEFSDLEMEIDLVYGNTEKQYLTYLINQVTGCNKFSVIELKKILPVILLQRKMIRKNEDFLVAFLGESYLVQCDNTLRIMVEKTADNGAGERIQYEDFSLLFYFDVKKLSDDFGDSKVNEKNILKIEAIEKQLDEKNKQNRLLQEQRDMISAQLEDANKSIIGLKDRIGSYEGTINALKQEKEKILLELEPLFEKDRKIFSANFSRSEFYGEFLLKLQVEDGSDIVEQKNIIQLEPLGSGSWDKHKEYYCAHKRGKIFWLIDDNTKKNKRDNSIDIAVICNKLDNKENVMKWYKRESKGSDMGRAFQLALLYPEFSKRETLYVEKQK